MARETQSICIQCGQATGDTTRFNRLPDGRPCAPCADRLLAALPSVLPASVLPEAEPFEEYVEGDDDYDRPA